MVTGDLNAALVEWVVQYRIDRPDHYLFNVREPDATLARRLRERDARGGRRPHGGRGDHHRPPGDRDRGAAEAAGARRRATRWASRIDQVQLKNVNPPEAVQASFNEVNQAQQERERAINVANGEYNKVDPARARPRPIRRSAPPRATPSKRVNEAEGDVAALQGAARRVPQGARGHAPAHLPRDHGRGAAQGDRQQDRSSTTRSRACCRCSTWAAERASSSAEGNADGRCVCCASADRCSPCWP